MASSHGHHLLYLALLVTFKLPKLRARNHCFIHSLCIPALFISFELFLCKPCSLLRASIPPLLRHSKVRFFLPLLTLLLRCIALLCMNCLGLSIFLYPRDVRVFLRSPSFFFSYVGRVCLGFLLFLLQTPFSLNPPPPVSPYKEEYGWAFDDLLAECSTLNSVTDVEAHRGDPTVYNFNAFHKTHDSHVLV